MLGLLDKTQRGFQFIGFQDSYDCLCDIQCSSAIDETHRGLRNPGSSYLWLGILDPDPKIMCKDAKKLGLEAENEVGWQPYPLPKEVLISTRMHLNRKKVKELIEVLQFWLNHGKLG